jgi:tetratricopeptide (TPR) repeat protein
MLDVVEANLGLAVDGQRSRRAFALQAECRDLAGQARVLTQIGYREYLAGAWDDAVAAYTEAGELVERLGDLPNVAIASANTAEIRVDQGRLDEAEAALLQAIRVWRASGSHNEVAFGRVLLGRVMAKLGRYDEADVLLGEARSRFVEQGAKAEVVDAEAYQAECLLLRGDPTQALTHAEQTLATAFRLSEQPVQASLLYRVVGAAHDALGHEAQGDAAFDAALDLARRRGASHDIAFTVAAMIARTRRTGRMVDPDLIGEALPIQRRLGLVIDLAGVDAGVAVLDLPEQREAGDEVVQVTA